MTYKTTLLIGAVVSGLLIWAVYLFSKWAFNKIKPGKEKTMRYIAIIPTILLAPAILLATFIGGFIYSDSTPASSTSSTSTSSSYKTYMIKDNQLMGKTRPEIIELLGNNFRRYDENTIVYDMEDLPWFFINDPHILKIHFWSGKVVKIESNKKTFQNNATGYGAIEPVSIQTPMETEPEYEYMPARIEIVQ